MKIYKTKMAGVNVSVVSTVLTTYFFNDYYGVLAKAVAEYDLDRRSVEFHIVWGNEHTSGGRLSGDTVLRYVKTFMKRKVTDETPTYSTLVTFTDERAELAHVTLGITEKRQ